MAAGIVGLSLAGFLVGIRPVEHDAPSPPAGARPEGEVLPGRTYSQLRLRQVGSGSRVTSVPATLREGIPAFGDPSVARTEELRLAAVAARARRRAFDGAPPAVPHAVDELSSHACTSCHAKGMAIEGRIAPVMSHPAYQNCLQCHAPTFGRPAEPWEKAQTTFVGLGSAGRGERAWPGAPPAMPHQSWMRQDCTSCHGLTGLPGLRTPHPERFNCQQCHAPRAGSERWGEAPSPLFP
jgi:cytochrome c-type protein NapB